MKKVTKGETVGREDPWRTGPFFYMSAAAAAWLLNTNPTVHNFAVAPVDEEYRTARALTERLTDKAEAQMNVLWSDIKSRMPKTPDAQQPDANQNSANTLSL